MKNTMHLLCACALIFLFSCGGETDTDADTDNSDSTNYDLALTAATAADCSNAPGIWFAEDGQGNRRTPAPLEGATSPFADNDSVSNCDFQLWSWQKFLWLTNEYNGRPLFMDSLHQVTAGGLLVADPSLIVLVDTSQASDTMDILKTPNFSAGTPPQTTVFSAIFQDDVMYQTMLQYAPIANNNPSDVDSISYPVGSLELKTTWMAVSGLADTSTYFITDGTINGVPNRVALLAMHVVGVVENHPEFIWATFEQDALAPNYDWDAATPTSDATVTSTSDYPFFAAGQSATTANITSKVENGPHTDVFGVYKYGIPVEKVADGSANGVQQYMSTCETNPQTSYNNIDNLNQSVKGQLTDIYKNYFLNGSLWINPKSNDLSRQIFILDSLSYHIGNVDTGQFARGSVASYNITMETYVQAGFRSQPWTINETNVSNLANCFSCHSAAGPNGQSPLYISHIFTGYMKTLQGKNRSEIKRDHVEEIRKHALLRMTE
ncbi:MAG: hypothetical protein GQ574_22665 [Crocinitomix sp.]|nr:hypothetical protein [Crocinitomix sp.]